MVDYAVREQIATRPRARARETSYLRNLDWVLLAAVGGIVAYGLWVVSGITQDDIAGDPNYYVVRQAAYALIGVAGMAGMILIDPGDGLRTEDTAWWCGWGPYESPELVVCAVIENGGFGGEIAAPSALQVFEEYFGVKATQVQAEQAD